MHEQGKPTERLNCYSSPEEIKQVLEKFPHLPREAPVHLALHAVDVRSLCQRQAVLLLGQYTLFPQSLQYHVGALKYPVTDNFITGGILSDLVRQGFRGPTVKGWKFPFQSFTWMVRFICRS